MQTILPPSGNTIKILGKARSAEHGLRWMTYVLAQPVEGGVLVFHTLTRALLLLTPEEYLFDGATVEQAVSHWKLKSVQITLDGTEEIYNRSKAFIYKDGKSPYQVVLANIQRLLDAGVSKQASKQDKLCPESVLFAILSLTIQKPYCFATAYGE